ncbi:hypothetical protein thsrh120_61680 [Rhizobium sp. No.120]
MAVELSFTHRAPFTYRITASFAVLLHLAESRSVGEGLLLASKQDSKMLSDVSAALAESNGVEWQTQDKGI